MGFSKNQALKDSAKNRAKRKGTSKPFAAMEVSTLMSPSYQELTSTQRHIYHILKSFYSGEKSQFKAAFSQIKQRSGVKHGGTVNDALITLEQKGWIAVSRAAKHGKRRGLRVKANEYELTFMFDYYRW